MSKIKIITDSASDITCEKAEKLGIRMIPISFTFDGETYYKEGIEMKTAEFYEKLKASETLPKTAQVTPIEFTDVFNEEYDNGYDTLIVVTISSKGSGMNQNAHFAAREVMEERGGEIIVVDSMGFSSFYGAPVVHAAHMLIDGKSKDEIVDYLNDAISSMRTYFLVDDLQNLKKGGRINAATLVIANMLDIKPVLAIKEGVVVQSDKLRGSKKIYKKFLESVQDEVECNLDGKTVIIPYTSDVEKSNDLKAVIDDEFDNVKFIDSQLGAVVGTHGGPGLVGIIFSDKYDFVDYED